MSKHSSINSNSSHSIFSRNEKSFASQPHVGRHNSSGLIMTTVFILRLTHSCLVGYEIASQPRFFIIPFLCLRILFLNVWFIKYCKNIKRLHWVNKGSVYAAQIFLLSTFVTNSLVPLIIESDIYRKQFLSSQLSFPVYVFSSRNATQSFALLSIRESNFLGVSCVVDRTRKLTHHYVTEPFDASQIMIISKDLISYFRMCYV